jgi:3-hydroxymyristoyl/3-hydroxydecanoyl-(acyl carrier protein) dehydratase
MILVSRRLLVDGRAAGICVLGEDGLRALRRCGHEAVARACLPALTAARVRFVDASQRSALESAADDVLAELYLAPLPARPLVTSSGPCHGQAISIALRIQPDLDCLRGHFPAIPLVPGAVQLGWALAFGAELLGLPSTMAGARSVKFERIIQPGHSLWLNLAVQAAGAELRFEFASANGRHSSGRIETRPADG